MHPLDILIAIFATFYLSYAIVYSDGPFGVFYKLRRRGSAFDCFICTTLWVSLIWTVAIYFTGLVIAIPFAIAGVATIAWLLTDG